MPKRYSRSPGRNIRLQDRDLEILYEVYRHRLLTTDQIARVLGLRTTGRRRIGYLYHHGYLERIVMRDPTYAPIGTKPEVYALTTAGGRLLAEKRGISAACRRWNALNRDRKYLSHTHQLWLSEVLVRFREACQRRGDVRFIPEEEIFEKLPEGSEVRRFSNGLGWRVGLKHRGERILHRIVPDYVFGFHFEEDETPVYFFLEVDTGTMTLGESYRDKDSTVFQKQVGYVHSFAQKLHERSFGFGNVRALFVTKSHARAENFRMKEQKIRREAPFPVPRILYYTDKETFDRAADPLSLGWGNGKDDESKALEEPGRRGRTDPVPAPRLQESHRQLS